MTSKRPFFCAVLAGLWLCACGNYSNDDLDFQLALPEASDLTAQMQLSVVRLNSAPYYKDTRSAITTFNGMVERLAGLIDLVRGITPTTRSGNERIWGPWPSDKVSGWEVRVVMQRSAVSSSLLRMDYWVQVRPVTATDSAWASFLIGQYTSGGSARTGQGEIQLRTEYVRQAGYPVDTDAGLANLDYLVVTYDNAAYPMRVTMAIANLDATTGRYEYLQQQDGSGQMSFDAQGRTETGAGVSARMQSEWIGSGAGRADLTAVLTAAQAAVPSLLGTDCWGADSIATYSYRAEGPVESGEAASCLF